MLRTIIILTVTGLAVLIAGINCAADPELKKLCLKPNGLFPGTSCEKFVNCGNGQATEQECPKGLHFSPTKSHCDYPKNVNCKGKGEITDEESPLKKLCLKPRGQFPGTSCKTYDNCWDDTIIEQVCPGDFLFSPEKLYCDYPENVKCVDKVIDENSSHQSSHSSSEEGGLILIDDDDSIICPVWKSVHIRSNKTNEYLAIDWSNTTSYFKEVIAVSEEDEKKDPLRTLWLVQFCKDGTYIHSGQRYFYMLDHRDGCKGDGEIGVFPKGIEIDKAGNNNIFSFDLKTGLLTVCEGKCLYKPKDGKKLKATADCSSVEDKHFYIEVTFLTTKTTFRHSKNEF